MTLKFTDIPPLYPPPPPLHHHPLLDMYTKNSLNIFPFGLHLGIHEIYKFSNLKPDQNIFEGFGWLEITLDCRWQEQKANQNIVDPVNDCLVVMDCLHCPLWKSLPYIFSKFNLLDTDTQLIWTLSVAPSVSMLMQFDCKIKKGGCEHKCF